MPQPAREAGVRRVIHFGTEAALVTVRRCATSTRRTRSRSTARSRTAAPKRWPSRPFTVPGEARRIADGRWTHVEFRSGQVIPVTVSGELIAPGRYGYKEVTGKWTAALGMQMGAANHTSAGSLILWVGSYFKDWPPLMYSPNDAFTVMAKNL